MIADFSLAVQAAQRMRIQVAKWGWKSSQPTLANPTRQFKITNLSEACRFYDAGSDRTLVWFGGLHEPLLGTRILEEHNFNGLFIQDLGLDWYVGGIVGIGDHESSLQSLETFLPRSGKITTFAGQSSGGYAALRYAHALKPEVCIAFAPQTKNLHGQPSTVRLPDIGELYRSSPPDFPVILHLSRSEENAPECSRWDDWNQIADLLKLDNVTVIRHPYDVHAVSLPLYGKAQFYETIVSNSRLYAREPSKNCPV